MLSRHFNRQSINHAVFFFYFLDSILVKRTKKKYADYYGRYGTIHSGIFVGLLGDLFKICDICSLIICRMAVLYSLCSFVTRLFFCMVGIEVPSDRFAAHRCCSDVFCQFFFYGKIIWSDY